jgi:hypothetical protein
MSQMQPIQTVQTIDDLTQFNPQIGPYDWPEEYEKTTVFVQGYYKAGDGGGGIFIYRRYVNLGVTQPFADGGIFIECDVSAENADTRGIWMRSFSGYIDVRYYGAMGASQNDTHKIQAAIDYVRDSFEDVNIRLFGHTNSNTVYLPNEAYFVEKLLIYSGVRLIGASMRNTTICSVDDDNPYLIELGGTLVRDVIIQDITFYGNANNSQWNSQDNDTLRHKGCFGFIADANGCKGIWESSFKNISINLFTGDSIRFQGSYEENDWSMPMQFITMEGVQVESVGQLKINHPEFVNNYHALVLFGACGQFSFNNCRFDGSSFPNNPNDPSYIYTTNNVFIGNVPLNPVINPILLPHPSVITFNTCTFQMGALGIQIESSNNIKIDSCWFERFERAIVAKGRFATSKSINILNSSFGFCAGNYGGYPDNTGRVITAQNSQLNVHNNYVIDPLQTESTLFIGADTEIINGIEVPARNIGINSSGNYFEPNSGGNSTYLGYTNGLKRDINITNLNNNYIHLQSSKTIYLRNDSNNTKTISSIYSYSVGGEYLFIRSDQGTIKFTESGNLYLGNREKVTLLNGDIAIFVKIDEEVHTDSVYYETYNLINIWPRV